MVVADVGDEFILGLPNLGDVQVGAIGINQLIIVLAAGNGPGEGLLCGVGAC